MSEARSELQEVIENLTDMPALPNVMAKLTRLISDPRTTASDINETLSSDPCLVAKILKLVNSSFYGFSRRIATITNAVVILGFNKVRNLALSTFIFDKFANAQGAAFDIKGFWKHSLGTAFAGAQIARLRHHKLEEDAFICGLLHDLGKFIMAQNASAHIIKVQELVRKNDILFYQAEKECLEYDHAILGALVMEKWHLPESLVDVVRHHHEPFGSPEASRLLCAITSLADILARATLMGNGGDARIPRLSEDVWSEVDMDWKRMEIIMRKAADDYSRSGAFFSIT